MSKQSEQVKAQALALYLDEGPGPAAEHAGVTRRTIERWAKAAALKHDKTKAPASPEALKTLSEYRAETALRLYQEANLLLDQLYERNTQRKAMTVSKGAHAGASVQIVDIALDKPSYSDQKHIMTAAAIALDKAHQLSGPAAETNGEIPIREVVAVLDAVIERVAPNSEAKEAATDEVVRHLRQVK